MKIDIIAPILISHAIEYLHFRPIGTKYHIEKHLYQIDGKTFARIVRHNNNMKAVVNLEETAFFNALLQYAVQERTLKLPRGYGKYYFYENSSNNTYKIYISKEYRKLNNKELHIYNEEQNANRTKFSSG